MRTRHVLAAVTAALALLTLAAPAGAQEDYTPPSISIDDNTLRPGQQFTITGTGCLPGETVTYTLYRGPSASGTGTVIGTSVAGADGSFSFTSVLPAGLQPGRYTITAVCGDLTQVLGITVSQAATAPSPSSLARTGVDDSTLSVARVGVVLVIAGALLVTLTSRRRRRAVG